MNSESPTTRISELEEKIRLVSRENNTLRRRLKIEAMRVRTMSCTIEQLQKEQKQLQKENDTLKRKKILFPKKTIDQFNFMLNRLKFYEPVVADKIDMDMIAVVDLPEGLKG